MGLATSPRLAQSSLSDQRGNRRYVQPYIYLTTDFVGHVEDYEVGMRAALRVVQEWYYRRIGKTFRIADNWPIFYGPEDIAFFQSNGAYECMGHGAEAAGLDIRNPFIMILGILPTGANGTNFGNAIGIDSWAAPDGSPGTLADLEADFGVGCAPVFPAPGRTGIHGDGLDVICGLPDPPGSTSPTLNEMHGYLMHEMAHCFMNSFPPAFGLFDHTSDDLSTSRWEPDYSVMFNSYQGRSVGFVTNSGGTNNEITYMRQSPFML